MFQCLAFVEATNIKIGCYNLSIYDLNVLLVHKVLIYLGMSQPTAT